MTGLRRCFLLVASGLLIPSLTLTMIMALAGYWLHASDSLERSDAIVVLAGTYERSIYAAELFKKGYAPLIYLSRPLHDTGPLADLGIELPRAEDVHKEVLLKRGVPDEKIVFFGGAVISTADEAEALIDTFREDARQLLVVTSPYHVKRAGMILRNTFDGTGLKVSVVGTPHEVFAKDWWTDQGSARNVILETAKIVFYLLGGRFKSPAAIQHPG